MKLIDQIKHLNPCSEAVEWLGDRTLAQAWRTCPRGDWMLWLAGTVGVNRKVLVRAAVECARPALKYVPKGEKRPAKALSVALAWTRGRATIKQVRAAVYAADAAAYAYADAAAYAASAAYAAYAATDAYAAANAAYAATDAYAAANAANAANANAAAHKKSLKQSADTVRRLIPVKLIAERLK